MKSSQTASETVRCAAAGISAHLLYQVSARLFSFIIKAVVVRALQPAQFAFAEIRVVLLVNLALLPAIHGFRPVTVRLQSEDRAAALSMVNSLLTCVLGLVFGLVAIAFDRENTVALVIVSVSVLIRGFVEIPIVFLRRRQRYSDASRARAIAIVISGISQTLAVSLITKQSLASPASTAGHLAYVIALGSAMMAALGTADLPTMSLKTFKQHIYRDDLLMVAVATGEGIIKFLLENGEAIVLDITCTPLVKGAYKIAANLGSVFARFFSEALEEQAFNVFSRLSGSFKAPQDARTIEMRTTCIDMLILGVKSAITVSFLFAIIGPSYSYAILRLLYGEAWADNTPAPKILSMYLIYIVFMAGNGVSEAFVSASASTSELKARTKFTSSLSIIYMLSLYQMTRMYGAKGLIIVNCFNMAMRTIYSTWFFSNFTKRPLTTMLEVFPHVGVVLTLIASRIMATWSEHKFLGPPTLRVTFSNNLDMLTRIACHGMSGVVSIFFFAMALHLFERDFIKRIRSLRSHQD